MNNYLTEVAGANWAIYIHAPAKSGLMSKLLACFTLLPNKSCGLISNMMNSVSLLEHTPQYSCSTETLKFREGRGEDITGRARREEWAIGDRCSRIESVNTKRLAYGFLSAQVFLGGCFLQVLLGSLPLHFLLLLLLLLLQNASLPLSWKTLRKLISYH